MVQENFKGIIEGRMTSTSNIIRGGSIRKLQALKATAMGHAMYHYTDEEVCQLPVD